MIDQSLPRIGVVGVGYVGLVTAVALAELGYDVTCVDIDVTKIARLEACDVPFFEPGIEEAVRAQRDRLHFTPDLRAAFEFLDVAFVCVDTPPLPSGHADLSRVESVVDAIPALASTVLVMKSTVPVGTGERIERRLADRGLTQVAYVSNPEFLREGSALADVRSPDRVVVGSADDRAAMMLAKVWAPLGGELLVCDVASAEMIKLASNAFLATKITFINEIANVCDIVGADATVVAEGMGLDRRIGRAFLQPGVGFGGSCFGKDVSALKQAAANAGYHFQLLAGVLDVNTLQKRRPLRALIERLGDLRGRRIAVLGLAFKPGTDDMRDAPSLVLVAALLAAGATVVAHDPVAADSAARVLPREVEIVPVISEALHGADAAVIMTEWPDYQSLVSEQLSGLMSRPLLIDGRNMLDPDAAQRAGWEWVGVGRPAPRPSSPVDVAADVVARMDATAC